MKLLQEYVTLYSPNYCPPGNHSHIALAFNCPVFLLIYLNLKEFCEILKYLTLKNSPSPVKSKIKFLNVTQNIKGFFCIVKLSLVCCQGF